VTQVVDLEFKPQYHKNNNKKEYEIKGATVICEATINDQLI
jgi:hypothetical protein